MGSSPSLALSEVQMRRVGLGLRDARIVEPIAAATSNQEHPARLLVHLNHDIIYPNTIRYIARKAAER